MTNRDHIHAPADFAGRAADAITARAGSWPSAGIHAVWFTVWFVLRLDINLLTLIVSLEAIFLAILLLISQNRQAVKDHLRDDLESLEVAEILKINQTQLAILQQQSAILALLHAPAAPVPPDAPAAPKRSHKKKVPDATPIPASLA